MKVTLGQVESGLAQYISREICSKLSDWRKWVVPVFVGSMNPKFERMFAENKNVLVEAGFVDQDNMIDIDLVYDRFRKAADDGGGIVQEVPVLGTLRLSAKDIDMLYQLIKANGASSSRGF